MRVHVIGNVALDETIEVPSMPQIGASILGRAGAISLGGKGANQAMVLGRSGLDTSFIAAIGEDVRATLIHNRLEVEPIDLHLVTLAGHICDFSIILTTADGENAIVTTHNCANALSPEAAIKSLSQAQPGDFVVLQGNLSEKTTRHILTTARARRLVTILNPSPIRSYFVHLWPQIDIVFMNQSEAKSLTGSSGKDALDSMLQRGPSQIVLTLGEQGAMLASQNTKPCFVPACTTKVVDTTGAGDSFMAVALASAARRGVLPEKIALDKTALVHAARASALTISRPGTQQAFPTGEELRAILV